MRKKKRTSLGLVAAGFALVALACAGPDAGLGGDAVQIDVDDIGGVVMGPDGPEAGVWVIAETMDLGTRFSKTVVTDDEGRYVVPDLPEATYDVWVRGYGLVDSEKLQVSPGAMQDLVAVVAPDAAAAGAVLSGRVLVLDDRGARERRVPRYRPRRQRHLAERP